MGGVSSPSSHRFNREKKPQTMAPVMLSGSKLRVALWYRFLVLAARLLFQSSGKLFTQALFHCWRSQSSLPGCLGRLSPLRCYRLVQEFDTHVGSQIAKQLEPPKKADAEFGYILSEVSQVGRPHHPHSHTIRTRHVA